MAATDLGTLIGTILSEVALARLRADLATTQAAELYQQDALLRHMPVPRFRLPEISVDLPVAFEDVEAKPAREFGLPVDEGVPVPDDKVVLALLERSRAYGEVELEADESKLVDEVVVKRLDTLRKAPPNLLQAHRIAQDVRRAAEQGLRDVAEKREAGKPIEGNIARLLLALQLGLQRELVRSIEQLGRLRVRANTGELQKFAQAAPLVTLRLTIQEESYELTIGEDERGDSVEHFLPE